MKFVDAFSGIGGFHVAIKDVVPNAECVKAIDFDKHAVATYKTNHGIDSFGDITKINLDEIPDHDLLMGGFPCQSFSVSGKWGRTKGRVIGESENRDVLFTYLAEILSKKRPRYFLFENVKGLLSIKNKDGSSAFETIKNTFKSEGYTVFIEVLDAADYGLPQQRKRLFFVGFREEEDSIDFKFPKRQPRTLAVRDILEKTVENKYLLKNLWKNRQCKVLPHSRLEAIMSNYNLRAKPTSYTYKVTPVGIIVGDTPSGISRQADRLYSCLGLSRTIQTFTTPAFDVFPEWRTLTPRECARLQGFKDSFILPKNDIQAYKQVGNSVAIPVVREILKEMLK